MRTRASVLHLDLDAFFASVEQRDKPSLRGKPVVVGGIGGRGVVATASYEARRFGVHSAMSMGVARRRAPYAAYLSGRFDAYRQSSRIVMRLLRELSPLVEQLSIDEAFVDLEANPAVDLSRVEDLAADLRARVFDQTGGLTASVGLGTSRFMAKVASELAKPDGLVVVRPGTEAATIAPLPARSVPGIGPATMERLARLGVHTVADIRDLTRSELVREVGSFGDTLFDLVRGYDERPIVAVREMKSISVEDTFESDVSDRVALAGVIDRDAAAVATRLRRTGQFARTVTLKLRSGDFTTWTRSRTLVGGTDSTDRIARIARELLDELGSRGGVRLLGVGVSHFVPAAQEELFEMEGAEALEETSSQVAAAAPARVRDPQRVWLPGQDIVHADLGRGWVWGSGAGVVTVRFETRDSGVGPVRSFPTDDPALSVPEALPPLPGDQPDDPDGDVRGPGWTAPG